jgi:hypothetical protein
MTSIEMEIMRGNSADSILSNKEVIYAKDSEGDPRGL